MADANSGPSGGPKQDEAVAKPDEKMAGTSSAPSAAAEAKPPADEAEEFPDPDEDDLDDLDDMLDDFSAVKLEQKKPTPPSVPADSSTKTTDNAPPRDPAANADDPFADEEFTKQFQAGMADLVNEWGKSPEMQAEFEDIFKQIGAAAGSQEGSGGEGAPSSGAARGAPGAGAGAGAGADASFQDTIQRTMERMQTSGDQATAAATSADGEDFMAEMLKQMSSGDFNEDGSGEDFSKMLMGMMEQLTNKDILYEPMKELNDKFPEWMDKNRATTPPEDLTRYDEQKSIVAEIVGKFEESTYSDSNSADREYIVDRMQKMQAAGSPPTDLVGDMASAQEAFNGPDESCNTQ